MGDLLSSVGEFFTGPEVEDPKDALELKNEADKAAEKKRLARSSEKEAGGKTIFSDPLVAGGMPLKDKLGA